MKLLLLLLASLLSAADRTGPYLSIGGGGTRYSDDGRLEQMAIASAAHYRLGAGAFINRHFSVALEFVQSRPFSGYTSGGEKVQERFSVMSAEAIGHYPILNEQIDFFAKFGAGELMWSESGAKTHNSNAGAVVYGLGVGFRPMANLTLNAGVDFLTFEMDDNGTSYDMGLGMGYLELQVQF